MNKRFCNDCYVDWDMSDDDLENDDGFDPDHRMVTKWLCENGAIQDDDDGIVLIKHWW